MIQIKGIIMSGGTGTRLRPLTCSLPKPMVPVMNRPVMEYAINLLKNHGITDIGVTLYYLPSMIMDHFGDGSSFHVNMKYYIEDKPLGTGGSVKNAEEILDSTFVVISGDGFTNMDLTKAYEYHRKKGSKATLILKREPVPLEYGVVITDEEGRIVKFLEKPSWGEVFSDTVNTGIYILEPEVLDYYNKGENFDFSRDLFPRLLKDGVPIYGYITEEYWCDIGDLETYIKVQEDIFGGAGSYQLPDSGHRGLWIGKGTTVEEGCRITPPVYIGENCIIREGADIGEYTVIDDNCIIGEGTSIKRSVIWNNTKISKNCEIRRAVICSDCTIDERVRVFEGAAIGSYSRLYQGSTIKPKVKIWPYKTVENQLTVKSNLIWENKASKRLFGSRNISGRFNTDITPEVATGLGCSISTVMGSKGTYFVSSDEHGISKAIKNALVSGIMSTGAQVIGVKDVTLPICRYGVKLHRAQGGVHVYRHFNKEDELHIELIDKNGSNLDKNSQRKVENTLAIENFKRCRANEIKDPVDIGNFSLVYLNEAIGRIKNRERIKKKLIKVLITSPSKNIIGLAEKFFSGIDCIVNVVDYRGNMGIKEFQEVIFEMEADLGFIYGSDGEKLIVADRENIISDDKYFLLSLLIGFKSGSTDKIIVPYNLPRISEEIAKKYRGSVIYSKTDISNYLGEIQRGNLDFQYVLSFDNILASGTILDYMAGEDISLRELASEIPEYYYLKKEIPCSWDYKGTIIRKLVEEKDKNLEMEEGIRFTDDKGWTLIIPDDRGPHLNIYVESPKEEYAEELFTFYDDKIKKLMKL